MSIKSASSGVLTGWIASLILASSFPTSAKAKDMSDESSEDLFEIVQKWGEKSDQGSSVSSFELEVLGCSRAEAEGAAECKVGSKKIQGEEGEILFESILQAMEDDLGPLESGTFVTGARIRCHRMPDPAATARCSIEIKISFGGGNVSVGGKTGKELR